MRMDFGYIPFGNQRWEAEPYLIYIYIRSFGEIVKLNDGFSSHGADNQGLATPWCGGALPVRVGCALAVVCCPVLIEIQAMTKSICTILFLTHIYIFNYTYILYVSIKIHIYICRHTHLVCAQSGSTEVGKCQSDELGVLQLDSTLCVVVQVHTQGVAPEIAKLDYN
jgi:hypothetical protein